MAGSELEPAVPAAHSSAEDTVASATDSNKSDVELLAKIARGDRQAFEELFGVYGKRIFRYAMRAINDVTRAEEVTNDVMVEVWKSAARFEGRSTVSTWIIGIARYVCLNAIRGKHLETVDLDHAPEPIDDSRDVEQVHDRATVHRLIREQVGKLSPEHRDVVELTFFHGHSYREIAEIAGCPENTVKTRMYHARRQLEPLLRVAGLDTFIRDVQA